MVYIIAASYAELRLIKNCTAIAGRTHASGGKCYRGTLCEKDVLLIQSGVGPQRAGAVVGRALSGKTSAPVVLIGAAGAADPALRVGDIVVADTVVLAPGYSSDVSESTGRRVFDCDAQLVGHALGVLAAAGLRACAGSCLGVDRFIHLQWQKKQIFHELGTQAIDMESGAVACVAASLKFPFLDLRVISDTAQHDTVDFNRLARQKKTAGINATAAGLCSSPSELARAARFAMDMRRVQKIIVKVVKTILGSLPGA